MGELVKFLLAPGLVAAFITFVLNTRDERHRTAREFHTKFFDETRSDIRGAVNAGVEYFSNSDDAKMPGLQAAVLLYEHEIRTSLAAIRRSCGEGDKNLVYSLEHLESDFLDYLTGGEFGSATAVQDDSRVRMIVGQGALLRGELSKLRRNQLEAARFGLSPSIMAVLSLAGLVLISFLFGAAFAATK